MNKQNSGTVTLIAYVDLPNVTDIEATKDTVPNSVFATYLPVRQKATTPDQI